MVPCRTSEIISIVFNDLVLHLGTGSQPEMISPHRRHLKMSRDIFDCNLGSLERVATGICWVQARDATNSNKTQDEPPQQRMIWSKMSIVSKLTHLVLNQVVLLFLLKIVPFS